MLKIHESIDERGENVTILLRVDDELVSLVDAEGTFALPPGAIDAVMRRYGGPIEEGETLAPVASLELPGARRLRHVRHLARFDVIAKDYLVYEAPGVEARCALATAVAGALGHLARRAAASDA